MKYIAILDTDEFKDFKFFEDAVGKYLAVKDAKAKSNEWLPLHFEVLDSRGDVVSRQAAIDVLRTCYDTETISMDNGDEYINYGDAVGGIEQLPSAQSEQKWIPCSERPPEENGEYLITVKYKPVDGYEDVYTEHGEWDDDRWVLYFEHCGEVESVLAWMPRPEPYREEDKG